MKIEQYNTIELTNEEMEILDELVQAEELRFVAMSDYKMPPYMIIKWEAVQSILSKLNKEDGK